MSSSSRTLIALHTPDLSSFAKVLRHQLSERHERGAALPGHVELLNMLARAAGHRNVQSLQALSQRTPATRAAATIAALSEQAERALRHFDDQGRLMRWPVKYSTQRMALWALWLRFDAKRRYSEREVNEVLNAHHSFGDHCTLRRELVNMKLLEREPDGSQYRKLAQRPAPDITALLHAIRARRPG